jgi:hypothetical protein
MAIRKIRAAIQVPSATTITAITSHKGSDPPGSSSSLMPSFYRLDEESGSARKFSESTSKFDRLGPWLTSSRRSPLRDTSFGSLAKETMASVRSQSVVWLTFSRRRMTRDEQSTICPAYLPARASGSESNLRTLIRRRPRVNRRLRLRTPCRAIRTPWPPLRQHLQRPLASERSTHLCASRSCKNRRPGREQATAC